MSATIEIPDELYARLEQQAKTRGVTVPQAIVQLVKKAEEARIALAIEQLRMKGLLVPTTSSSLSTTDFEPLQVQGQPLSVCIIEERR